jgi:cytochrome c biogenesis protein ResB
LKLEIYLLIIFVIASLFGTVWAKEHLQTHFKSARRIVDDIVYRSNSLEPEAN